MEIVLLTKDTYEIWDKFCLQSDDAWFWHTTDWLEYTLNYKPELKTQNISFLVYKQDRIEAVIPLTLEIHKSGEENIPEFSFGGGAIPAPAFDNTLSRIQRNSVCELIFNELDRLAYQNKVVRTRLRLTPISPGFLNKNIPSNYLMEFGYIDTSLNTRLINLKKTEEELWDDLRRNHRRNINKEKKFEVIVYTSKNITKDIFNDYKEMHHKAAGRKTRPDKTFELMYDWLIKDSGFLAALEFKGRQISFEYYIIYKNNVYGGSAANDPDFKHLSLRHLLEWEAILWMKRQGFSFYEIGLQQYGILPYDFPDKKQLGISHFKKGFGGFTIPLCIGEKFYSKEYYKKIDCERKQKFLDLYAFEPKDYESIEAKNSLPKTEKVIKKSLPEEEVKKAIIKVLVEEKEAVRDLQNNRAINFIIGKIKRHIGREFNYELVYEILQEELKKVEMPL